MKSDSVTGRGHKRSLKLAISTHNYRYTNLATEAAVWASAATTRMKNFKSKCCWVQVREYMRGFQKFHRDIWTTTFGNRIQYWQNPTEYTQTEGFKQNHFSNTEEGLGGPYLWKSDIFFWLLWRLEKEHEENEEGFCMQESAETVICRMDLNNGCQCVHSSLFSVHWWLQ